MIKIENQDNLDFELIALKEEGTYGFNIKENNKVIYFYENDVLRIEVLKNLPHSKLIRDFKSLGIPIYTLYQIASFLQQNIPNNGINQLNKIDWFITFFSLEKEQVYKEIVTTDCDLTDPDMIEDTRDYFSEITSDASIESLVKNHSNEIGVRLFPRPPRNVNAEVIQKFRVMFLEKSDELQHEILRFNPQNLLGGYNTKFIAQVEELRIYLETQVKNFPVKYYFEPGVNYEILKKEIDDAGGLFLIQHIEKIQSMLKVDTYDINKLKSDYKIYKETH